jgi:hypothetical protein
MLKIITALIFLIANAAQAATDVTVNISHPTRYTNGDAMPMSAIVGYKVFYSVDEPVTLSSPSFEIGPVDSFTLPLDLAPRAAPYNVRVVAQTRTVDALSDMSGEFTETTQIGAIPKIPNAPIIIEIIIQCDSTCRVVEGDGL